MRKVVLPDGTETLFHMSRLEVGEWWQSWDDGPWFIVTASKPGETIDECDDVNIGFFVTLREATAEELEERIRLPVKQKQHIRFAPVCEGTLGSAGEKKSPG